MNGFQYGVLGYDIGDSMYVMPVPLDFEVVRSFDSPAASFEATFACDRHYPELYKIELLVGDRTLFLGFVDECTVTENEKGRCIKIIARSKGALLLDNEAAPQKYLNISLQTIFANHIKPYGFQFLQSSFNPVFNSYQIAKGTSEWEVFYNFYRDCDLGNAYIDEDENVICSTEPPRGNTLEFSNTGVGKLRYSSLKITNNRYSPVSKFLIRDKDGVYSSVCGNSQTDALKLQRRRYIIPPSHLTEFSDLAIYDAKLRIKRSMLGKLVVTLTCPGIVGSICDRVNLDTGLSQFRLLFVQQTQYRLSSAGLSTTLTLLDKQYI